MAKNKLFADIYASTAQTVFNQASAFVLFFLLSRHLDKGSFGSINWILAVLLTASTILGLGYDQLAVKKTARGIDIDKLFSAYFFHVLLAGALLLLTIALSGFLFSTQSNLKIFTILALSQFLSFLTIPCKQIANGLQRFGILGWMSITANFVKLTGVVVLTVCNLLTVESVAILFGAAAAAELAVCLILYRFALQLKLRPGYNFPNHRGLIKESLPQLGITVCNVLVLRADWILVGILTTAAAVADYSFAYRCFEFSVFPVAILGPVLLPRIVRLFARQEDNTNGEPALVFLVRIELMVAIFIGVVLNTGWQETVDLLTANKYGSSTQLLFLVLSFCGPLLYLNNIFWSINFAHNRMRTILRCIVLTFLVNIGADLLLIPVFSSLGAAVGFLMGAIVQTAFYARHTAVRAGALLKPLLTLLPIGVVSFLLPLYLFDNNNARLIAAPVLYVTLLLVTGQWQTKTWIQFKKTGMV